MWNLGKNKIAYRFLVFLLLIFVVLFCLVLFFVKTYQIKRCKIEETKTQKKEGTLPNDSSGKSYSKGLKAGERTSVHIEAGQWFPEMGGKGLSHASAAREEGA